MKTMNEQQVPTVDQFVYIIIKCDVTNKIKILSH